MTFLSTSLPLVALCTALGGTLPQTPVCVALAALDAATESLPAAAVAPRTAPVEPVTTPAEPAELAPAADTTPVVVAQAETAPARPAAAATPAAPAPAAAEASPPAGAAPEATSGGRVSAEARPLVEKVQRFYENTDDFKAKFHQTYTYTVGRQVESRGEVAFKKPAMMRWDYQHPRERTFIVDGTDLWVWTPEDFSVVRQRDFTASDLSTSITFLWGEGRLADEFHIELEGADRLVLTPIRPEGGFRQVIFRVDAETGRVIESTVIDPQGNRNHMVFSDVDLNSGVDAARFRFSPPTGADVQDMPSLR
jgi:outer membrane lipoprotein carrier protein